MKKTQWGFTLIELIMVLALLGILMPSGFAMFMANIRAQTKVLILQEVKRNGDAALDTIESLIKVYGQSLEQEDGTPVCDAGDTSYTGDIYFVDQGGERFLFHELSERIASESATTSYLTSDKVRVANFEVSCARESQFTAPLVSVSFDIEQARTTTRIEESASLEYQTKVRLRNL